MLLKLDKPANIRVSGGFWLLISWFAVSCGWRPLVMILAAAAIHELGHLLALRVAGAEVTGIYINALGAVLEVDQSRLSYIWELAVLLAGPLANLACAMVLAIFGGGQFAVFLGANLVLCVFNLLPAGMLDGARALELLLIWLLGVEWGEKTAEGICCLMGFGIGAGCICVLWKSGGSLWLLPVGGSFLWQNVRYWGKRLEN